jgi:hypothetical protein
MIQSQDKDNRTLAVEMLANCNIEESFDIVSYLFFWYYDWFKDSNNWNNINVKTLRKRLEKFSGSKDNNRQWGYDQYITLLIAENKLTDFIVKKTIKKMYDSVIRNTFGCKNNVFSIDLESIYLEEKYKNLIITTGWTHTGGVESAYGSSKSIIIIIIIINNIYNNILKQ